MIQDSRRKKILQNVVTTLQGIQGPPYSLRLPDEMVKRQASFMELPAMLPAISVVPGREFPEGGPINKTTLTLKVRIRLMIDGDADDIADKIEDGLADVRHIMVQDTSRGLNAFDTIYAGCAEPVLIPGDILKSQLDIDFDVLYRTDFADPTLP